MITNRNSGENLTELVFENKNKAYGAYALRASQGENVTLSVMSTALFFGLVAVMAFWLSNRKVEIFVDDGNIPPNWGKEIVIDKPEPKIEPKTEPKKAEAAPKTTSGALVASNEKSDSVDLNEDQNISKNPNPKGAVDTAAKDPVIPMIVVKKPPMTPVVIAKKMPEMKDMAQFIADNLVYPRVAVDNGTSGTVFVTFVVETDGSISNIETLHDIGDGCAEEAKRVVRMMPKWTPGENDGEKVRVQCNLPIKFRIK